MKRSVISVGATLFAILLTTLSRLEAAGVAAYKEQPFHQDSTAVPIVYTEATPTPLTYLFKIGSRTIAYDRSKVAALVTVNPLPQDIKSPSDFSQLQKSLGELTTFASRFEKCSEILKPYINELRNSIAKYQQGEVCIKGQWHSKEYYASILQKEAELKEAARKAELKREQQMQQMREREEAFTASQRHKGLEKYGNEWLPREKVNELVRRDRELSIAAKEVDSKSIKNLLYSVFQVLPKGMLIEPIKGDLKNKSLHVDLVFLRGVIPGTAAEGDYYRDDFYWCGTYSYLTKSGIETTIHAYSLDYNDAVAIVRSTLFQGKAENPPETKIANHTKIPAPLKEAHSTGSGFFVGNQGYFVTNAHVVEDASDVSIFHNNNVIPAAIIHISKAVDLALLKIDRPIQGIGFSSEIGDLGMDVYAIGFPNPAIQGLEVKITKGIISSNKGINDDDTRFQIDAAIQPGNSGGPLCDAKGKLVGVIVSALNQINVAKITGSIPQNVNYAIKSSEVMAFLRTRSVQIQKPDSTDSDNNIETNLKVAIASAGLVIVKG